MTSGIGGRGKEDFLLLPPKYRLLSLLKEKVGLFVKGTEVAEALGISKAAVWKHVVSLRKEGYKVEASKREGYRLVSVPKKLLPFEVAWGLDTKRIARLVDLVHHKDLVGSTQEWAKFEAEKGAAEGSVYIAEGQMAGRGRMGREWFSPEGKGIWVSILLRPKLPPRMVTLLSLLAANCAAYAVEKETGVKAFTKWPNDIVVGERKLGGVLVEMAGEPDWMRWVVVGIGLNVNIGEEEFPPEFRGRATSVAIELGKEVQGMPVLRRLILRLDEGYDLLLEGRRREVLEWWKEKEATLGKEVTVETERGIVTGTAVGVTMEGALILRTGEGKAKSVWSGTVLRVE